MTIAAHLEAVYRDLPGILTNTADRWMINHIIELACHFSGQSFDPIFRHEPKSIEFKFPDGSRLFAVKQRKNYAFFDTTFIKS